MLFKKSLRKKSKKKILKKLFVSNLWDEEEKIYDCKLCGSKIISNWGDYVFQLYREKDKSDIGHICSKCALKLQSSKEKIKVTNALIEVELLWEIDHISQLR